MFSIRTLCLFGLTLVLSGCPAASNSTHTGYFSAAWDLEWVGTTSPIYCQEAGVEWVDLDMVDRYNNAYHDRFPCSANQQTNVSRDLPAGDYSVVMRLRDSKERLLSATDPGWFTIVSGAPTDLADSAGNPPVFDLQAFYLDWTVFQDLYETTCGAVGAKSVEVRAQLSTESTATTYLLSCAAGRGNTPAVPVGTYSVQVNLLDSSGLVLMDEKAPFSKTVTVGGSHLTDLGTVDFDVY